MDPNLSVEDLRVDLSTPKRRVSLASAESAGSRRPSKGSENRPSVEHSPIRTIARRNSENRVGRQLLYGLRHSTPLGPIGNLLDERRRTAFLDVSPLGSDSGSYLYVRESFEVLTDSQEERSPLRRTTSPILGRSQNLRRSSSYETIAEFEGDSSPDRRSRIPVPLNGRSVDSGVNAVPVQENEGEALGQARKEKSGTSSEKAVKDGVGGEAIDRFASQTESFFQRPTSQHWLTRCLKPSFAQFHIAPPIEPRSNKQNVNVDPASSKSPAKSSSVATSSQAFYDSQIPGPSGQRPKQTGFVPRQFEKKRPLMETLTPSFTTNASASQSHHEKKTQSSKTSIPAFTVEQPPTRVSTAAKGSPRAGSPLPPGDNQMVALSSPEVHHSVRGVMPYRGNAPASKTLSTIPVRRTARKFGLPKPVFLSTRGDTELLAPGSVIDYVRRAAHPKAQPRIQAHFSEPTAEIRGRPGPIPTSRAGSTPRRGRAPKHIRTGRIMSLEDLLNQSDSSDGEGQTPVKKLLIRPMSAAKMMELRRKERATEKAQGIGQSKKKGKRRPAGRPPVSISTCSGNSPFGYHTPSGGETDPDMSFLDLVKIADDS